VTRVRVRQWDIEFDVEAGESVFDASFRAGWLWPTTCFGQAQCTRCHVKIVGGGDALPRPDAHENEILERLRCTAYRKEPDVVLRLACQLRPVSDLDVEIKQSPVRRTG
jgi:2Fe-2S ferredoxin